MLRGWYFLRDWFLFFLHFFLSLILHTSTASTATTTVVVVTPAIYCFVCSGESWLAHPPNKSSSRPPPSPGRCRGQTMHSLLFFMREEEGQRAHWRRGSDWDVITSAEVPRAIRHCRAILVRWEISHDEIRCILLIPEGKLGHFGSKWCMASLRVQREEVMKNLRANFFTISLMDSVFKRSLPLGILHVQLFFYELAAHFSII